MCAWPVHCIQWTAMVDRGNGQLVFASQWTICAMLKIVIRTIVELSFCIWLRASCLICGAWRLEPAVRAFATPLISDIIVNYYIVSVVLLPMRKPSVSAGRHYNFLLFFVSCRFCISLSLSFNVFFVTVVAAAAGCGCRRSNAGVPLIILPIRHGWTTKPATLPLRLE